MILPGKEPIIFVPCRTSFCLTILFMKSVFISAFNKSTHSIQLNSILNNGILPYYIVHSESNYLWTSDVIKLRVSQTGSWCDVTILSVVCKRNPCLRVQPKRECCSNQQYFSTSTGFSVKYRNHFKYIHFTLARNSKLSETMTVQLKFCCAK